MSDRWSVGLLAAMGLCCAGPVLIGTGLAATVWAMALGHWPWLAAAAALVVLVVAVRARNARARKSAFFCASSDTHRGIRSSTDIHFG